MKRVFLLLIGSLILVFPSKITAQSFSFQIAPQLHEIVSQRGKTVVLPYSLTNIGDPQLMTVSIYTFHVTDNEGNYAIKPFQAETDGITFRALGGALELNEPVIVRSNETIDFDIEITIPPHAQEADYMFSVIAETETQSGFNNASEIQIKGGIGSNILLTVSDSGATNSKGQIVQFDILSPQSITFRGQKIYFFNSNEPIPVLLIAANQGTNYTKASGSITLIPQYSDKKSELPSFTIHPQYIFSGSQRALQTAKNPGCESKEKDICKSAHSLVLNSPVMGIYKLAAVVSFGESTQIGYGNITFIAFPFTYLAIGMFGFLLILYFISRLKQK